MERLPERILVIFPGALGDFVCFLPALQRLAEGSRVDLLARSEYAALVPENVATRSLECYEISRLFAPGAEHVERLSHFFGSYGRIYSWMASGQADFVQQLRSLSKRNPLFFPFRPSGLRMHMTDYYLSCIGTNAGGEMFVPLAPSSDAVSWRERFWQDNGLAGKQVLTLAPGSGAKEKNWPAERYALVAEWWEKTIGGRSLIVLGPVEEEKPAKENVWGHRLIAKGLTLAQLAALLARSDLYLGNDSGVTHLAAALGVQTIVLFGPSDLTQWSPRGKRVIVISRNVACSPCPGSMMKLCLHHGCLTTLSDGAVIGVVKEVLDSSFPTSNPVSATLTRKGAEITVIKDDEAFCGAYTTENPEG